MIRRLPARKLQGSALKPERRGHGLHHDETAARRGSLDALVAEIGDYREAFTDVREDLPESEKQGWFVNRVWPEAPHRE